MDLSKVPTELILGASSFLLGYLAHLRGLKESSNKATSKQEQARMHFYELELENITTRQQGIQEYMEKSISRLEKERDRLNEKIITLNTKIDRLEKENLDWQMRYIDIVKKCSPDLLQ